MSANHGNTPAAWTSVTLATVGLVIGAIATLMEPINITLFWIGMIVFVVAFPLWALLNKLGYGD